MATALITGASEGLGRALARSLLNDRWSLILDARRPGLLADAYRDFPAPVYDVTLIAGDIADPRHREALLQAVSNAGGVDLLVHNASTLGPTPLAPLKAATPDQLLQTVTVNAAAPLALTAALLPLLTPRAIVVTMSSDAAVEHYPGWGLYGASKAALDHLALTFAEENPDIAWYAIDPGDMRTTMHQQAFPGEDIGDRPLPETVVPAIRNLLDARPVSGRYRAQQWADDRGPVDVDPAHAAPENVDPENAAVAGLENQSAGMIA